MGCIQFCHPCLDRMNECKDRARTVGETGGGAFMVQQRAINRGQCEYNLRSLSCLLSCASCVLFYIYFQSAVYTWFWFISTTAALCCFVAITQSLPDPCHTCLPSVVCHPRQFVDEFMFSIQRCFGRYSVTPEPFVGFNLLHFHTVTQKTLTSVIHSPRQSCVIDG